MGSHIKNTVRDEGVLRKRVANLFSKLAKNVRSARRMGDAVCGGQLALGLYEDTLCSNRLEISTPSNNLGEFLDLISCTVPEGDLYLFGGVLRDLALFGEKGFSSDIDIVVDGDWDLIYPKLIKLGAIKNKFGGFRLMRDDIPIDIWLAKETWAVKNNLVAYRGIASLLDTTVLNWDAILMNWRTKSFLYKQEYFSELNRGYMDVVLERNPNPLGMLVRILRHVILKDAKTISYQVLKYVYRSVNAYTYEEIVEAEYSSYGNSHIHMHMYDMFRTQSFSINECVNADGICLSRAKQLSRPLI